MQHCGKKTNVETYSCCKQFLGSDTSFRGPLYENFFGEKAAFSSAEIFRMLKGTNKDNKHTKQHKSGKILSGNCPEFKKTHLDVFVSTPTIQHGWLQTRNKQNPPLHKQPNYQHEFLTDHGEKVKQAQALTAIHTSSALTSSSAGNSQSPMHSWQLCDSSSFFVSLCRARSRL